MKFKYLRYILVVLMIAVSFATLCGCIDLDEIMVDLGLTDDVDNMNNRVTVVIRDVDGVTLKEGTESIQEIKRCNQFRIQF